MIVTASERSFVSLRPLAAHLVSYEDLSSAISTILARLPVTGPVMVIDCIGDASRTVEPIAKIVHGRKGSKVAVMLPVRVGGTGKTVGVEMEVNGDFGEGVEVLGVRTHFYEKVSRVFSQSFPIQVSVLSPGRIERSHPRCPPAFNHAGLGNARLHQAHADA